MIKEKFNEKQYWEERTDAFLKETETIHLWNQDAKVRKLEKHIDYIQKVLKEKQDELFCLKFEIKQQKNKD